MTEVVEKHSINQSKKRKEKKELIKANHPGNPLHIKNIFVTLWFWSADQYPSIFHHQFQTDPCC